MDIRFSAAVIACMCWWCVRCEQGACPSMINSYLADKGVYNFISSAEVSLLPAFDVRRRPAFFTVHERAQLLLCAKCSRLSPHPYIFTSIRLLSLPTSKTVMTLFIVMHTHTNAFASHRIDVTRNRNAPLAILLQSRGSHIDYVCLHLGPHYGVDECNLYGIVVGGVRM